MAHKALILTAKQKNELDDLYSDYFGDFSLEFVSIGGATVLKSDKSRERIQKLFSKLKVKARYWKQEEGEKDGYLYFRVIPLDAEVKPIQEVPLLTPENMAAL